MSPGASRPAQLSGRSPRLYVGSSRDFVEMCLHEKRKAKAVDAVPPSQPAATWCVIALAKSVEFPHGPINTPSNENQNTPPLLRNSTCKAFILRVVARPSLIRRVVRL
jgi:hypothetical protein